MSSLRTCTTFVSGAALALTALLAPAPPAQAAGYVFTDFDAPAAAAGNGTTVDGISNTGTLVGFAGPDNTDFTLSPGGTFTTLTALNAGAIANGINSAGDIVGMDGTFALLLPSGAAAENVLLPVNATTTAEAAFGINDAGLITGQYADSATGLTPGFVDKIVGGVDTYTTVPVPTGFASVNVQGINNNGLAVGFYTQGTVSHGFTYDYNTSLFTTLADPTDPYVAANDFLFSQVLGINDSGLAVGYFGTTNNIQHGFLYDTTTGTYTYLDDPSVVPGGSALMQITGIANSGEIAGFYSDANGTPHGFFAAAVPEAPCGALFALGLLPVGLLAARRREARQ